MSFQKSIIENVKAKGFTNFLETELLELEYKNVKADIVHNNKSLLMIKNYENWLHLKESWEMDQISVLNLLKEYPSYSTKAYFILILDNYNISEEKFDMSLIERDDRICKKYLITEDNDLLKIPVINKFEFNLGSNKSYEKLFYSELSSVLDILGISSEIKGEVNQYFNV